MDIRPAIYDPEREAADRLRDAAPDLLKACELLDDLDWIIGYELTVENHEQIDKALQAARAAIRKAKGA